MDINEAGMPQNDAIAPDYTGLFVGEDLDVEMAGYDPYAAYGAQEGFAGHKVRRRLDPRRVPATIGGVLSAGLAVLCVVMFVYMLFLRASGGSRVLASTAGVSSEDLADNRATIVLPVFVPDLDSRGSRVPVYIVGTLEDGTAFEKETYVSHDGTGIRLEPGTYELSVMDSPISSNGTLYVVPDTVVSVVIGSDLSQSLDPAGSLIFSVIGALNVTDEQIDSASALIAKDPERNMYAESLAERARARRDEARREIESAKQAQVAQDAARKEAEEKAKALEEAERAKLEQERQQQEQEYPEGTDGTEGDGTDTDPDTDTDSGGDTPTPSDDQPVSGGDDGPSIPSDTGGEPVVDPVPTEPAAPAEPSAAPASEGTPVATEGTESAA